MKNLKRLSICIAIAIVAAVLALSIPGTEHTKAIAQISSSVAAECSTPPDYVPPTHNNGFPIGYNQLKLGGQDGCGYYVTNTSWLVVLIDFLIWFLVIGLVILIARKLYRLALKH